MRFVRDYDEKIDDRQTLNNGKKSNLNSNNNNKNQKENI